MSKFLDDCIAMVREQPFDIIRISEYKDGKIETAEYLSANPCQNTYSVAKTFTMTAIGMLWDRGLISLDEKVCEILADELPAEGMDERWYTNTVEMVLTHRSGLPGGFLDIDTTPATDFGENYLEYMFRYPMAYTPGEEQRYSDGAFYLLSRIAAKKAGEPMDNFLWRELFYPMGFREMAWSHCPHGHPMGATGLYIRSDDMVKLGALYLQGGEYGGRRYLSEEWVRAAMENDYAIDCDEEKKIFFKGGMFGQKLIIHPEGGRAVALQAFGANSDVIADFVKNYKE